jgi:sialic acid synthase SpsE
LNILIIKNVSIFEAYTNFHINTLLNDSWFLKAAADVLESIDVPFIKIGSGDTDNFPLLEHVAKKKRNLVLSTGAC